MTVVLTRNQFVNQQCRISKTSDGGPLSDHRTAASRGGKERVGCPSKTCGAPTQAKSWLRACLFIHSGMQHMLFCFSVSFVYLLANPYVCMVALRHSDLYSVFSRSRPTYEAQ